MSHCRGQEVHKRDILLCYRHLIVLFVTGYISLDGRQMEPGKNLKQAVILK